MYALSAATLFLVLGIVAFLPGKKDIINFKINQAKRQQTCVFKEISADKLVGEIISKYYSLNIIDVRSSEDFEKFHLPFAINIPFEKMMDRQYEPLYRQRLKTNIFYANNDTLVKMACLKAKFIGHSENYILKESATEFQDMFFQTTPPQANAPKSEVDIYNFRKTSGEKMTNLADALKNIGAPVKRKVTIVKGGC